MNVLTERFLKTQISTCQSNANYSTTSFPGSLSFREQGWIFTKQIFYLVIKENRSPLYEASEHTLSMTHSRKNTFKGKWSEIVTLLIAAISYIILAMWRVLVNTTFMLHDFVSRHIIFVSRHPFFIFVSRAETDIFQSNFAAQNNAIRADRKLNIFTKQICQMLKRIKGYT